MLYTNFYPRKRKKRLSDKKKLKRVLRALNRIQGDERDFDVIFSEIMIEAHLDNLNHIGKNRREYKEYKNKLKSR